MSHPAVFRPLQASFLTVPQSPLSYWVPERLLASLANNTHSSKIATSEGLGTRKNDRFVRFIWESTDVGRWHTYSKGGSYGRWFGHDFWTVEWEYAGARVKAYIAEHYPPEKFTLLIRHERLFGQARLAYSTAGCGSLGVREVEGASIGALPTWGTGMRERSRELQSQQLIEFLFGRPGSPAAIKPA